MLFHCVSLIFVIVYLCINVFHKHYEHLQTPEVNTEDVVWHEFYLCWTAVDLTRIDLFHVLKWVRWIYSQTESSESFMCVWDVLFDNLTVLHQSDPSRPTTGHFTYQPVKPVSLCLHHYKYMHLMEFNYNQRYERFIYHERSSVAFLILLFYYF